MFELSHRFLDQSEVASVSFILQTLAGSLIPGSSKSYTFRCHREDKQNANGRVTSHIVHAVNDISFHPTKGTLASAGKGVQYL